MRKWLAQCKWLVGLVLVLLSIPAKAQTTATVTLTANVASSVTLNCTASSVDFGNVLPGQSNVNGTSNVPCTVSWFLASGQNAYLYEGFSTSSALTGSAGNIPLNDFAVSVNGGSYNPCDSTYGGPGNSIPNGQYCGTGTVIAPSPNPGSATETLAMQLTVPNSGIVVGSLSGTLTVAVAFQ